MSSKNKIRRFRENETFKCIVQPTTEEVFRKDYPLKGKWAETFFGNSNPIILELGCGKGEYTVALARKFPNINFIGIDIKGARLWRGAKTATDENISNVGFIRTRIEFIESLFGKGEIAEIWITFADPQIKRDKKRLTYKFFLDRYRNFLVDNGIIHLKTDSRFFHEYTLCQVRENDLLLIEAHTDIYGTGRADEILSIKTFYESQFVSRGIPITYLAFRLPSDKQIVETTTWNPDEYIIGEER